MKNDGNRFLSLGLKRKPAGGHRQPEIRYLRHARAGGPGGDAASAMGTTPQGLDCHQHPRRCKKQIILQAHKKLLETFPNLLLILVPRHPERFPDAREMVQKAGMSFTLRSTGEIPSSSTQVVIGDTMGELMLLYGIADLAFVGGSLVERGGHNPLEPAAHAIPVLMGPHTFNFKDICAKLQQDDGLITVTDADSLVREVSTLLTDEDYRLWYGRHAVEVLHQNQGALSRLLQLLQPYLPQRSH